MDMFKRVLIFVIYCNVFLSDCLVKICAVIIAFKRESQDYPAVGGITIVNVAEGTLYRIFTHACYKALAHRVHACDEVDGVL